MRPSLAALVGCTDHQALYRHLGKVLVLRELYSQGLDFQYG